MKELTIDIHQDSPDPMYIQLKDQVKTYIVNNHLAKGTPLPSIKIIAEKAGVTLQTAERGMTELIKEGICYRRPKKGTFVDKISQPNKVECVGIYFNQNLNVSNQFEFYSILNSQLCEQLTANNIHAMVWMDSRQEAEKESSLLPDLAEAIEEEKIQYMFLPLANDMLVEYLDERQFRYSITQSQPGKDVVYFDRDSLLENTMEAFKKMGVNRVGMITNEAENLGSDGRSFKSNCLCDAFIKKAADHGLSAQFEWVKSPPKTVPDIEQLGYELFNQLWHQDSKPDGVFVFPDTTARGVISAILKQDLAIPDDLKLVFHKNREVHLFHPFPAAHVVNVVENVTSGFMHHLNDYISGRSRKQQNVHYELEFVE